MHDCPECGQACYCSGDIEDHDTDEQYVDICYHCDGSDDDLDDLDAAQPIHGWPIRDE